MVMESDEDQMLRRFAPIRNDRAGNVGTAGALGSLLMMRVRLREKNEEDRDLSRFMSMRVPQ